MPTPIVILISDLHLSLAQPACRADKDWMEVQAGYLQQVKTLADQLVPGGSSILRPCLPVICSGDIFDRWNAPPELINFALEHLPDGMLCVPGQHDLPNHRMDLMHRSGYGVLVKAGKIKDLSLTNGSAVVAMSGFVAYGFGWDEPIESLGEEEEGEKATIHVAVIHKYVWTADKKHPGASETANLCAFKKDLRGYDVAVFGDNHKGFLAQSGNCVVLNCGGFIRRKSDEIDYEPCVGILYSDGTVKRKKLDTSGDRFHADVKDRPETPFNMREFIAGLEGLGEHGLDFREAVENHLRNEEVDPATREIILEALK